MASSFKDIAIETGVLIFAVPVIVVIVIAAIINHFS